MLDCTHCIHGGMFVGLLKVSMPNHLCVILIGYLHLRAMCGQPMHLDERNVCWISEGKRAYFIYLSS